MAGPNGSFSVKAEAVGATNMLMQYTAATTGGVLALLKPAAMAKVPSGDYFVEARIKPQTNSTTGNKQLYLITRYNQRHQLVRRRPERAEREHQHPGRNRKNAERRTIPAQAGTQGNQYGFGVLHRAL
ncbi:hypothetical protein [Massilia eburnea]|uniref:hypothetical protein n=1 Tax=Massilia eburnea TaxID=1776165 RepID=UPI003D6AD68C